MKQANTQSRRRTENDTAWQQDGPLSKHVGHKVTVTGTQVSEENEAKEGKEGGGGEYADLRVSSLKMVSEGCK